jgi:hypothetical protein
VVFYNAQKTATWAWSRAPIAAGNVRTSTGVNSDQQLLRLLAMKQLKNIDAFCLVIGTDRMF